MTINADDYTLQDLWQEREWRKCAPDTKDPELLLRGFIHFCENFWSIRHPERGRIRFDLFDAQIETTRSWLSNRWSLVLKARQIGFSTLVAAFAFWQAFFYQDRPILMLSRTEREAIKLLQKSKYGYQFLPEWMRFRGGPVNQTQTKMEFDGQASYIESLPSASDPARGESAYLIIVDELAFLPNSEQAWSAIEPVAQVGGRVIMLSTANGEGNLFHKLWVGAETKTNRFTSMFHPWWANGRTQEWYDEKKLDLPEWQMAQEYPDNPDDAFLRSGRPVFNLEVLRAITTQDPISRGFLADYRNFDYEEQIGGPLKVWAWPSERGRYAIGADVAEGMEHGDFSSAHVINARNGEVVAHWHGRIDPDLFGTDVLAPLGRMYGGALIGVENNNHGLTTLKALQRSKYHPIYMQRSPRYKRSVPTDILGWRTTQITKPVGVDELGAALRQGNLILYDAETVAELRTYVRGDNNKMQGSPFDDRTMSLMIANQMLKHVWLQEYEPRRTPGPGTMGWLEKQLYGDSVLDDSRPRRKITEAKPIGQNYVRSA